jgi:hypothetical protein
MINVYVYDHWTHVILVWFNFNWFYAIYGFKRKKMHYSEGKVLMNSNVWNEWYDDKKNTR